MDMQIRDRFARQRAELANERTLLAYIRTSLGFVFVGVPAIWWLERLYVPRLRVVSLRTEILCLVLGIRRFMAVIVRDRNPDHQLWDMG
jgi:putative membrane protein